MISFVDFTYERKFSTLVSTATITTNGRIATAIYLFEFRTDVEQFIDCFYEIEMVEITIMEDGLPRGRLRLLLGI